MSIEQIVAEIDKNISILVEARKVLTGTPVQHAKPVLVVSKRKHHNISAAGRKRIAEAQRARWAKLNKETRGKKAA